MYRVFYTRQAQRTLRRVPAPISSVIQEKIQQVAENPHGKHNNVRQLLNRPAYRLRVGDWRVIYEVDHGELRVLVIKIAPRGEVYR